MRATLNEFTDEARYTFRFLLLCSVLFATLKSEADLSDLKERKVRRARGSQEGRGTRAEHKQASYNEGELTK